MQTRGEIAVIGAGVIGLSVGLRLLRAGYKVTIYAREQTPDTLASDRAAAIWLPFHCGPQASVFPWAIQTLRCFINEFVPKKESGCSQKKLVVYLKGDDRVRDAMPSWVPMAQAEGIDVDFNSLPFNRIPEGFVGGYAFNSLVMDASVYMPYLRDLFLGKCQVWPIKDGLIDDGRIENGQIESPFFIGESNKECPNLATFVQQHPVTINCSGLGARKLGKDKDVYPARGQVMRVPKPAQPVDAVCYNQKPQELVFAIPRDNDMIIGGTAEDFEISKDFEWFSDSDYQILLETNQGHNWRIGRDAKRIGAAFDPATIIETTVGLRPCRKVSKTNDSGESESKEEIRLEPQEIGSGYVVHNYGHGVAGYTVSWGCAEEVVEIVNKRLSGAQHNVSLKIPS